jgi:hypothetical protein
MKMVIELDPDSIHQMMVTGLMEYHTYLARANWHGEDDERIRLVHAFNEVIKELLTDDEYYDYNREVTSTTH